MLKLENISKKYGDLFALKEVNLEVKIGSVIALLGPNGAGKTTAMKIMSGILEPDSGQILYNNENLLNNRKSLHQNLGYMPENNPLYLHMTTVEYLRWIASLHKIKQSDMQSNLDRAITLTELSSAYYRPIGQLSKGFRQRVGLAASIIHKPELLILDEPTEGLDPNQRISIRSLIKSLGQHHTVILSTHVLAEAAATCDRIIILNQGKVVADQSTNELVSLSGGNNVYVLETKKPINHEIISAQLETTEIKIDNLKDSVQYQISTNSQSDLRDKMYNLSKQHNWELLELYRKKQNLEDIFYKLTDVTSQNK